MGLAPDESVGPLVDVFRLVWVNSPLYKFTEVVKTPEGIFGRISDCFTCRTGRAGGGGGGINSL